MGIDWLNFSKIFEADLTLKSHAIKIDPVFCPSLNRLCVNIR